MHLCASQCRNAYDGEKPIYEYKADGSRAASNVYGKGVDEILLRGDYVVAPSGQGYFYQQDHEGSVTYLTGFSGEKLESYRYDAFGAPTTSFSNGIFNNRFKFTGREYQSTYGFYEYRNRAYHPVLGRFMSEDPMGFAAGDYNLFRYCGNDPVDKTDPMGFEDFYPDAHVTAYAYGNDNSYAGHRNGADSVALATDPARREIQRDSRGNIMRDKNHKVIVLQHAALGDGTFEHPSSMATHPDSKIPNGSRIFVGGKISAWYIKEDVHGKKLDRRFDMYAGKADRDTLNRLDHHRDVTVYQPGEDIPKNMKDSRPGAEWRLSPDGSRALNPSLDAAALDAVLYLQMDGFSGGGLGLNAPTPASNP